MSRVKRCHYEVLSVSQDCSETELKKAYKLKALQFHPDKNRGREVEAEEEFKLVQEAYDVLSDPHDRSWYDAHREQILRGKQPGEDEEGQSQATDVDLFAYFSNACYDGFDDEEGGFYQVYRHMFQTLAAEEVYAAGKNARLSFAEFGQSDSEWSAVKAFYAQWESFNSSKTFAFADKYNLADADNRDMRRAMEKENKKDRAKEKKAFNSAVRELVAFVRKRDPRVKRQKKADERARIEREEERRLREQEDAQRRKERTKEMQKAREEAMEEDAEALDEILASIELDDKRERRKARKRFERKNDGDNGDEDDDSVDGDDDDNSHEEEEEEEEEDLYCVACRKKFRTAAQIENHQSSKKHIQAVARMKKEIEEEDKLFFDARDSEDVVIDTSRGEDVTNADDVDAANDTNSFVFETASSKKKKKKKKAARKRQQMASQFGVDNDSGDENEDTSEIGNTKETVEMNGNSTPAQVVEEESTKPMSKREKRKERERRKAEQQKTGGSGGQHNCNVCGESYPSRTKLMKHVDQEGHARAGGTTNGRKRR